MLQQDQKSLENFVGREVEQNKYRVLLEGEEEYWLLFLTGIPGIGKTSLLHQLKKQTPDTVGTILIDFQDTKRHPNLLTDPLQVLEALADAAKGFCNEAQYTEFQKTLQRGYGDIQRFNEEIKQLEQINEPEQLVQIKQNMRPVEQEIQRNTWKIVSGTFYALIDTLEKRQLVLMLDTCERLLEPGGLRVSKWLMNEFLPMLHNRVGQLDKSCFVVIASRELLPSDIIGEREQHQFALSLFTLEEINDYLEQARIPVKKGSLDFQSIFQMTQGHPLSLSIIRELWGEEGKTGSEKNEDIAEFQSEIADSVSETFVEKRILKRLAFPYRELTEYAVLLRSFNMSQLQTIFPELLRDSLSDKQVDARFDRFTNYPYIEPIEGYRYTFHEFVREVLAKHTRKKHPEEWELYHKRALDFFTPEEGVLPSPEWYYHFIAFNELEGMRAWKQAIEQARAGGRSQDIRSLLQVPYDKTLNLTPQSQLMLLEEQEKIYRSDGNIQEAEEIHQQAEQIKRELGLIREEAEEPQAEEDGALLQKVTPPEEEGVPERRKRRVLIPLPRGKPSRREVAISLVGVALVCILIFILILQVNAPTHVIPHLAPGIGVTQLADGESIGLSDGSFAFDANCQKGNSLKCQASYDLRNGDVSDAKKLWRQALGIDSSDAEAGIYLEDQQVLASGRPYIRLVVATTLTGPDATLGRDNLQGAYIAQGEYNSGFKLANGVQVFLLIANFGSDPSKAATVAGQIVRATADKTIIGVMGFPLSAYVPQVISILQQAHIPVVSSGATSDAFGASSKAVNSPRISPDFFRVIPPNFVQASVGANYAFHTLKVRTATFFYDPKDASGEELTKDFERDFMNLGGFVREETYKTGQSQTLQLGLQNMENNTLPDLLYFAGSASDLKLLLRNLPASSNLRIMGSDRLYQPQDYAGVSLPGSTQLYFTAFAYPTEWNDLCHDGLTEACSPPKFFALYPTVFGAHNPHGRLYGYTLANSDTIVSYDALTVLLTTYKKAGSGGQKLQAALQAITGAQAFQGVSGQISFDAQGNPVNKVVMVLSFHPTTENAELVSGSLTRACFVIGKCSNP